MSMNINVLITEETANGRVNAVETDNFRVTIFDVAGNEIQVFDPFSSAPSSVALATGEYYVEAHSNNLVDAAFDNPYYFGRSVNFTIDKEETTSVDIEATLANCKVAFVYSTDVLNDFDIYEGTVTVSGSGNSLTYVTGETREGFFVTSSPLEIEVRLTYNKLDGSTISRSFTTSINDPQPQTQYNINVDASLDDGEIVFNLIVNEDVQTIDIDLGETLNDTFIDSRDGQEYTFVQIGSQTWMAENLNYNAVGSRAYNDDESLAAIYGRLYDWPTMMNGDSNSDANPSGVKAICPDGWHMPSDAEWLQLEYHLGLDAAEAFDRSYRGESEGIGSKLKAVSDLWNQPNFANNESGFSALPAGFIGGDFIQIGAFTIYWSTSGTGLEGLATTRTLGNGFSGIQRLDNHSATAGANAFSCRCVKD